MENKKGFPEEGVWVEGILPMIEGRCPPVSRLRKDGNRWIKESMYPVPTPDYEDPEIYETETYSQEEKDEWYAYVTRCKKCNTEFMAYDDSGERIIKFCPGCGEKLI